MSFSGISTLAAAMLLLATSVSARSVSAADPESVADALRDNGYRAEISEDSNGNPMIRSHASGVQIFIFFYGCENNRDCKDLAFASGFIVSEAITMDSINSWNKTRLMGRAYLDNENDPALWHFVAGVDAMPAPMFKRLMTRWDRALGEFKEYIDW